MPQAGLYKAQTAAGFSTLLPWNWIITKPDRGFRHHQLLSRGGLLSEVTGHPVVLSPLLQCCACRSECHRSVIGGGGGGGVGDTFGHGVRPNPPLLCCARVGRGAPTPGLPSDLRTRHTAVQRSFGDLRCAHCYFNYCSIFKVYISLLMFVCQQSGLCYSRENLEKDDESGLSCIRYRNAIRSLSQAYFLKCLTRVTSAQP